MWGGILEIFRDYGYRRLRNRARLKFLVADWGAARFREVLETEYLRRPLHRRSGAATTVPAGARDHVGIHPQRDGRVYVGAAPTVGRINGAIARTAGRPGAEARLRPRPADRPAEAGDPRRCARAGRGLSPGAGRRSASRCTPTEVRRSTMACTGIEFCKLAIVNTKDTARTLVDDHRGTPTRPRRPPDRPRQRLPQLVRPVPGRRHRAQGDARPRRRRQPRSRASRCTSAGRWATPPDSAASRGP